MPLQTAVNPQTNETMVLVEGEWQKAEQVAANPKDQSKAYLVGGKWLTDTGQANLPTPDGLVAPHVTRGDLGKVQAAESLVSGIPATIAAGYAGMVRGATNLAEEAVGLPQGPPAHEIVDKWQNALTYKPDIPEGKKAIETAGEVLSYLGPKEGAYAGEGTRKIAQKLGAGPRTSGALATGVDTAVQFVPQMLIGHGVGLGLDTLKGAGAGAKAAEAGAEAGTKAGGASAAQDAAQASGRAQAYAQHVGLDWNHLSDAFKAKLTGIATDAKALGKLNPEAVKRQGLLAQVGIDNPTKGQVTRNTVQQRVEQLAKGTETGKPLKDLDLEHNAKLLEGVETLRKKVTAETLPSGAKARGDLPVGKSVQDLALRAKAAKVKKEASALYTKARNTEPDATAGADALFDLLDQNPHIQHLGWVNSWLKRAKVETKEGGTEPSAMLDAQGKPMVEGTPGKTTRRELKLVELDDLKRDASAIAGAGGTDGHYAGQVLETIEKIMDQVPEGAKAWKEASMAWRKYRREFSDQGAVKTLVEDKPRSTDRRMAIEDTAKKTVLGHLEDLQKVKRSLLTGKDAASRAAGKIAWRDLKGWGIDYIRDKMTKGPKGEDANLHARWNGLRDALNDIGDENLDELYGPTVRKQLRRFQDAAEILWTEAPDRVKGPNTFDKVLTFLDRIGNSTMGAARIITDPAAAVTKGVRSITEYGEDRRSVRAAQQTPIDEQLSAARREVRRSQNLSNVKRFGGATAPATPAAESRPEE